MHAEVPVQWLDSLRSSGRYDFHQGQAHVDVWEWFKRLLTESIGALISTGEGLTLTSFLFYAIIVAALVAGVYLFLKGGATLPAERASHPLNRGFISEEHLHEINFDRCIGEAAAAGDFRLAVRFLYLQALYHLEQHAWILIKAGKTNRDYERDLAAHSIGTVFRAARLQFEHVWYGNHDVGPVDYDRIRSLFLDLQMKARRT